MKHIPYITAYVVAIGFILISPIGAETAHAGLWDMVLNLTGNAVDSLGFLYAEIIKWTIYAVSSLTLWLAGQVFDIATSYSLGLGQTNIYKSDFISEGWIIVRDVANMAFIFGVLYIAITTILRATTRQTRQMLVYLIIVALLVNFSLFFTQVVIDASNILALEFYTTLTDNGSRSLSTIFMSGFNPQGFAGTNIFEAWVDEHDKSSAHLIFMYFTAGAVQFYAAWLLFFVSFLFFGRIAVLWILMVISPIMLTSFIFKKTRNWFFEWMNKVLSQAFLAPIFLFFFFLIAKFIALKDGLLPDLSGIEADDFFGEIIRITIPFIFLAILMRVTIKVTTKMSGEVAGYATAAVKIGAGAAIGAPLAAVAGGAIAGRAVGAAGLGGKVTERAVGAGRVAGAPLRAGARALKEPISRPARRALGRATEEVAAGEKPTGGEREKMGRVTRAAKAVARGARYVPGVARGAAALAQRRRTKMAGEGRFADQNPKEIKNQLGTLTSFEERAQAIRSLAKKKDLVPAGGLTSERIENTVQMMKNRGEDVKDIEKFEIQYADTEKLKDNPARLKQVASKVEPDNLEKVPKEWFTDETLATALASQMRKGHMDKMVEGIGEKMNERRKSFFDFLGSQLIDENGNFLKTVEDFFKKYPVENARMAGYAHGKEGKATIEAQLPIDTQQVLRAHSEQPWRSADISQVREDPSYRSRVVASIQPKDIEQVPADVYFNLEKPEILESLAGKFKKEHIDRLLKSSSEGMRKKRRQFFTYLGRNIETDIGDFFEYLGNMRLARYARTPEGRDALESQLSAEKQQELRALRARPESPAVAQPGTPEFRETEERIRQRNPEK